MAADAPKRRGRPPGPLSPEYQEVLGLYLAGTRPADIARQLGKPRSWANRAVQVLREAGAIPKDARVPTGRAPAPRVETVRLVLELQPDELAAIDREVSAENRAVSKHDGTIASRESWAIDQLRRALGMDDRD